MPLARCAPFAEWICLISFLSVFWGFCKFLFLLSFCDCNIFISRRVPVAFVLCMLICLFFNHYASCLCSIRLQRVCASRSPQVTLLRHNSMFLMLLKLLTLTLTIIIVFFSWVPCVQEALLFAGVYKGELELLTSLLSLSQTGFRAFICTVADCRFIMGCISGESNLFWSTGSQLSRQLKATASSHVSMATAIRWPKRERHDPLFE